MPLGTAAFRNSRTHEAGVVEISFHPRDLNLVASGSYDERLRLWDVRNMSRPTWESSKLGDGVWRVRWHPEIDGLMALAVMREPLQLWHAQLGSAVKVGEYCTQRDEAEAGKAGTFLGYGIDWRRDVSASDCLASASFYDHSMHIWSGTQIPVIFE